ncbi:MAG: chromosome partitioning protein [Actinomycetota bacterium]|nr:chromosome partitioning protein [Actinomycetota bacterium]
MIVVVAALKGGVGKTTTSVYLSALAGPEKRSVTLVDADPQASAADWVEHGADAAFEALGVVEAPTERLLTKVLDQIEDDAVAIVDTPPGHERLLAKALEWSDAVVIPTRVGGVETARVEAVLDMLPKGLPAGLVIASARTFTRDYQETVAMWAEAGVPVWGTVPERVNIATGPDGWLSAEGLDAYGEVWRRAKRAGRGQ